MNAAAMATPPSPPSRPVAREVRVSIIVRVTVDAARFTDDFNEEFSEHFFPVDCLDDHLVHLGRMFGDGTAQGSPNEFIEGYGPARDMGIAFEEISVDAELIEAETAGDG